MQRYSLSHLADPVLLRDLSTLVSKDCGLTAELLAHIAEVDERGLYRPAAYSSMFAYCVGELHMSEDAAYKRIQAARAARQFPAIFEAVADGRLHLSAIVRLAPHLTHETADQLLAAAVHKSKSEIETLLAKRFPQADMPTLMRAVPAAASTSQAAAVAPTSLDTPVHAASINEPQPAHPTDCATQLVPEPVLSSVPNPATPMDPLRARSNVAPLAPGRFALQLTMSQVLHDKLRRAQSLLGHAIPSGDIPQVLERALDELIVKLEKRKFAATSHVKPRRRRRSANARYVPADVRRSVWERDGGQCTFISDTGRRCTARTRLEFDHVREVARGGEPTVAGIRLRCRAHNQFTAERTFGAGFMEEKRRAAMPPATSPASRALPCTRGASCVP